MNRFMGLHLLSFVALFSITAHINAAKTAHVSDKLLRMCRGKAPLSSAADKRRLQWLLEDASETSLLMESSSQHQAACWMLYTNKQKRGNKQLFYQRYALATLYYATTHSNSTVWDWHMAADIPLAEQKKRGNWMHPKKHECDWYGVHCNLRKRVTDLDLGFMKLDGLLPRELSLLSELRDIDVHGNDLQGVVPYKMVMKLSKLEYLRLHMNGFFGSLQKEIIGLKSLKQLIIFGNYFTSNIPSILGSLKNLEVIDMYANGFSGKIPSELGQLKKLKYLDLHDNDLTGRMPQEICDLRVSELIADCLGPRPEVQCDCCTICCRGLPQFRCVEVSTGKDVMVDKNR